MPLGVMGGALEFLGAVASPKRSACCVRCTKIPSTDVAHIVEPGNFDTEMRGKLAGSVAGM